MKQIGIIYAVSIRWNHVVHIYSILKQNNSFIWVWVFKLVSCLTAISNRLESDTRWHYCSTFPNHKHYHFKSNRKEKSTVSVTWTMTHKKITFNKSNWWGLNDLSFHNKTIILILMILMIQLVIVQRGLQLSISNINHAHGLKIQGEGPSCFSQISRGRVYRGSERIFINKFRENFGGVVHFYPHSPPWRSKSVWKVTLI